MIEKKREREWEWDRRRGTKRYEADTYYHFDIEDTYARLYFSFILDIWGICLFLQHHYSLIVSSRSLEHSYVLWNSSILFLSLHIFHTHSFSLFLSLSICLYSCITILLAVCLSLSSSLAISSPHFGLNILLMIWTVVYNTSFATLRIRYIKYTCMSIFP